MDLEGTMSSMEVSWIGSSEENVTEITVGVPSYNVFQIFGNQGVTEKKGFLKNMAMT